VCVYTNPRVNVLGMRLRLFKQASLLTLWMHTSSKIYPKIAPKFFLLLVKQSGKLMYSFWAFSYTSFHTDYDTCL
jgi:hypothetical protein